MRHSSGRPRDCQVPVACPTLMSVRLARITIMMRTVGRAARGELASEVDAPPRAPRIAKRHIPTLADPPGAETRPQQVPHVASWHR